MLPKTRRLSRPDFLLAKSKGKSYSFPHFSALVLPNALGFNRFSVVTSSKLHQHAVVRNRLRRRLYDLAKDIPGNFDIIIFPKKSIFTASDVDLCHQLKQVINT